jgi:hypothetical protein
MEETRLNGYAVIVAATVLATVLGACSTAPKQASSDPDDEMTYVTGSRLPVKRTGSSSTSAVTDRSEINSMMNGIPSVGTGTK